MISDFAASVNGTDVTALVRSIELKYQIGIGPRVAIVAVDAPAIDRLRGVKAEGGVVKWSYRIDHLDELVEREMPSSYIDLQLT